MRIGVVLLDLGSAADLSTQLEALAAQTRVPDELVVVGQRATHPAGVDYHRQSTRSEPVWRNAGAVATTAELIAYCSSLDPVGPSWVDALLAAAADPDADLIGGWYARYDPNDPEPAVKPALPSFLGFLTWAYGQNLAVKRDVLDALGGWNEDYRAGHWDVDLCFRAQLAGYALVYAPQALVRQSKEPLGAYVRRRLALGAMDARLWADYGSRGFPARPFRVGVREWLLLARRLLHLPRVSWGGRRRWVRDLCESLGRVAGSVRYRVRYF